MSHAFPGKTGYHSQHTVYCSYYTVVYIVWCLFDDSMSNVYTT